MLINIILIYHFKQLIAIVFTNAIIQLLLLCNLIDMKGINKEGSSKCLHTINHQDEVTCQFRSNF